MNVKSSPTAAIAASGQSSRGRTAQKQSATTSRYAVPSGLRNVDTARRKQVALVAGVEDEVLRQAPRAVVVEAELLVEVGGNVGVLPALDRHRVHLHDPEHGDAGGGDEHEPPQRRQLDRAPEEVRGDAREVVSQRIEDRRRVGSAAERALRQHRVEEDERCEDERQRVDERRPEREAACGDRVARDPGERHGEQHLLPRGDQAERRALDAEREEPGHDRVVHREADDEGVDGVDGPPPDGEAARRERHGIDDEGGRGHGVRLPMRRAGSAAPARRRGLLRRPGAVAADGGEHQHGDDGTPGEQATHRNTSPRSGGRWPWTSNRLRDQVSFCCQLFVD